MKIELTTDEWTEVTGLEDDTTYFLQAKKKMELGGAGEKYTYRHVNIHFAQEGSEPENDLDAGFGSAWKFTKGTTNVYVKATELPCIVYVSQAN